MDFRSLIAPFDADRFVTEVYGRRPLHVPGEGRHRIAFGWARMNDLLGLASHWTPGNLRLILNSRAVADTHYIDRVETMDGPRERADPRKIDQFLGIGASLVANAVDEIAPEIAAVCDALGDRFGALASANVYCSFKGVQAFATHYDTHEVFALQCEGEKRWRIYANRADDPVNPPADTPDAQARIDAARGPVALEVTMKPGDLLYIPRGTYHDALATDGASLHVTIAMAPRTGRLVARLIETHLMRDAAFRAYLPSPAEEGGAALMRHLSALADRAADIMRSPGFAIDVADRQRHAALPRHRITLPDRPVAEHYLRTQRPADVMRDATGGLLRTGARRQHLGPAPDAAEWALARPAFSTVELAARFPQVAEPVRRQLVDLFLREGLIERYDPVV